MGSSSAQPDSIIDGLSVYKARYNMGAVLAEEYPVDADVVSSPPFRHTCHYGTDIDSEENLIANKMTIDEICRIIGADSLGYISIEGFKKSVRGLRITVLYGLLYRKRHTDTRKKDIF